MGHTEGKDRLRILAAHTFICRDNLRFADLSRCSMSLRVLLFVLISFIGIYNEPDGRELQYGTLIVQKQHIEKKNRQR